ncbi:hypothetical protein JYU34_010691 [Plutella xylostella]|uniref:Uncharacterized protein n=1 Tax=Plutella xylostella TaxID=51655 RepID=A0ABQ7QG86_PLUXY|nr:hypothetical protein JYU34_010691 [Plutella xylostella]
MRFAQSALSDIQLQNQTQSISEPASHNRLDSPATAADRPEQVCNLRNYNRARRQIASTRNPPVTRGHCSRETRCSLPPPAAFIYCT